MPITRTSVKDWPIDKVIPYEKNPKAHGPEEVADLVEFIDEFTFLDPIAVDENGVILEGHRRRLAAIQRKMKTVPVFQVLGLSEEQKRAYRIAHNKTPLRSEFDDALLASEFIDLDNHGYSLELTGFSLDEIGDILDANTLVDVEPAEPKKAAHRMQSMSGVVKVAITVEQASIIERALAETGEKNRGEALTVICKAFLNGPNEEGQFDLLAEG